MPPASRGLRARSGERIDLRAHAEPYLGEDHHKKWIYKTRAMARADVFDYIEMFYNLTRRHSYLAEVSPLAFEHASK